MPSAAEILAGAATIAQHGMALAVAWHVVIAAILVGLVVGWRPSQRTARALLALPLASVAAFAVAFDNPFNGSVFAFAALVLAAPGASTAPVRRGGRFATAAGIASLAYGWFYPHFLATPLAYLIAAPVGLLPCPTLAAVCGFALLGGGLASRAWSLALAALALLYGVIGVLRLGVVLDVGLIATALALGLTSLRAAPSPSLARTRS